MANYKAPGVYIEDISSVVRNIQQVSTSVGVLIGVTPSGVLNTPKKVTSFTEYETLFANGLPSPFLENSYLSYSVFGFFQNGGKELYIISLKKNGTKATKTSDKNTTVTALTEGAWGNKLAVEIKQGEDYNVGTNPVFDVTITLGTNKVVITDCLTANVSDKVLANNLVSKWIGVFTIEGELQADTVQLAGGTDGEQLNDGDYIKALSLIDTLDDSMLIGIPGQTTSAIDDALISYCENNGKFPILDMPKGSTVEDTKAYRKKLNAWTGALCYPWGKVYDPLTDTLKAVPCVGHYMGVIARMESTRGPQKAPAGVTANMRGFVEMETTLSKGGLGTLNPIGVICIMPIRNAGIVVWGARSLNSADSTMRYVSDGLMNLMIKKSLYDGTLFAVFEDNTETLWGTVRATCKGFLETLRSEGALKGTAEQAYYVKVDGTNNVEATIDDGYLNIEVGYAPIKPAEFVVIKIAHSMRTS